MRRIFLLFLVLIAGCALTTKHNAPEYNSYKITKNRIKYGETVNDKQDLFINIDGKWVKFYQRTRATDFMESPRGDYLIINDYAATKCCYIRIYDIGNQELLDLTSYINERMRPLSEQCWYNAVRFVDDYTVEFHINTAPVASEIEARVVEALNKVTFELNIREVIKKIKQP